MTEINKAIRILRLFRERDSYMVEFPSDIHILYNSSDNYLNELAIIFESGNYKPSPVTNIEVPKPRGMFRYYAQMKFSDQLYYTWLVLKCIPAIIKTVNIQYENLSEDEILQEYVSETNWKQKYFHKNLTLTELQKSTLSDEDEYMFSSDITNFSLSIDHHILTDDLRNIGVIDKYCDLLKDALSTWSSIKGRGLPQIFWATDILSELYLYSLDNYAAIKNYHFVRVSDNIELYGINKKSVRNHFFDIVRFLSTKGLYLNEAKTCFTSTTQLRNILTGNLSNSAKIKNSIKNTTIDFTKLYYSTEEKLGLSNFKQRMLSAPHDTIPYLIHYSKNKIEISEILSELIISDEIEFEYQRYSIIRWIDENPASITDSIKKSFHKLIYTNNKSLYCVFCAIQILIKHGNENDKVEITLLKNTTTNLQLKQEITIIEQMFTPQFNQ